MDPATKELLVEALNAAKMGGAELRRRAHRPLSPELRRHAREADRASRRHRLDRHRRSRARERRVGLRRVAGPHEGGRRRRRARRRSPSRRRTRFPAADRVRARAATPTPETLRGRRTPIDPFTIPVEQKAHLLIDANTEAMKVAEREVREQHALLREGRPQLREHRRLVHHADGHPQLGCRSPRPRCRPTSAISSRAATSCSPRRAAGNIIVDADLVGTRGSGARKRRRSSRRSRSTSAATISCCTRRTSGSRFTNRSGIPRSSIARWATRRTTPARASSRRREKMLGSSSTGRRS